jgi:MFS family permease
VGALCFVAARRFVPDSRDPAITRIPDLAGAGLVAIGIAAMALGLVDGPRRGWSSSYELVVFAVAVVGLVGFWLRSQRHPLPVVEPALLRVRAFAWSNATAVLFSLAFAGGLIAIVLWLQDVWGYSALTTGLAIAPGPLMVPVFAAVSQRISGRVPPGVLAAVGCVLFAAGTVVLASSVGAPQAYATEILPGWLLGGVGVGFALPTIMSAATADLPAARAATGSAVVTMARQVGFVLGVSVFVAVIGTPHGYTAVHDAFRNAWWVIAGAAIAGALTALGMTPRTKTVAPSSPEPAPRAHAHLPMMRVPTPAADVLDG